MVMFEAGFLKMQHLKPLLWLRYIDDVFFIWTHDEEELNNFLKSFNELDPYIKFTYESDEQNSAFLEIKVSLRNGQVFTDLYVNLLTVVNIICLLMYTTIMPDSAH